MGVVVAQFLHRVGGKIRHQEGAARPQDAGGFADSVARFVGKMQHHVQDHEIERPVIERQLIHICLAHIAIAMLRLRKIGPRHREHVARLVDADSLADAIAQQLQHATCPRADVQQ